MTEAQTRRLAGFLGLCARAGQPSYGQEACVGQIRLNQAAVALLDADSSPNTKKRLRDACQSHPTPLFEVPAGVLGAAMGKAGRMCVTLPPGKLAKKTLSLLQQDEIPDGLARN